MSYDSEFPTITFGILSVAFMIGIWMMGGNLDFLWRVMFTLCAPVGIYFALAGKRIR